MAERDLAERVDDLLRDASWNLRLPMLYASGDPEIVELVHAEGMPMAHPLDLMHDAVDAIRDEMERLKVCDALSARRQPRTPATNLP